MNSVEDFLEQFLVGNRAHKSMFAQPVNNFPHF
jgi:hypothetical protein